MEMKSKCLIIGGAGFIGTNLSLHLIKNNYEVTVYDSKKNPFKDHKCEKISYIQGDFFNNPINKNIILKHNIVFFLACNVRPQSSMDNPSICYDKDIIKLIELLDILKGDKNIRLVFISSGGAVYGDKVNNKLSEDLELYPVNHYGILKETQEKIIIMYNKLFNLNSVIFRVANPYGVYQNKLMGVGAVTVFLDSVINNKNISLYGAGDIVRDYIYIDDLVNIIRLFLEKDKIPDAIPIYNLGTGEGSTLTQLIEIIEEVVGKKAIIQYYPERNLDVKRNVLDISKLEKVIGKYNFIDIRSGISLYYNKLNTHNQAVLVEA